MVNNVKSTTIANNTLLLYFRMLFIMIISFLTSRLVLQVLGVTDFGIYNVVGGVVVLFTFISNPLKDACRRYLTYEIGLQDYTQLRMVFSASVVLHVFFSMLILILSETVGFWFLCYQLNIPENRFYASLWVYQFSIFTMIIYVMESPYIADIVAHEDMKPFAYISVVEALLKLLMLSLLFFIDFDQLIIYAFLLVIIQIIIFLLYFAYCKLHYSECRIQLVKDRELIFGMTSFMGWTMTGGIATIVNGQGLNMLLNIFYDPTVNAARGLALQMQGALAKFSSSFQTAINPQLTKSFASGDLDSMHKFVILSSKYSFYLLYVFAIPIMFTTDVVLYTWLGVVPLHTANFFRLVIIDSLLLVLANPMITSVHATGRLKKFQIVVEFINMLVLPISYIFLKVGSWEPEIVYIVFVAVSFSAQIARVYIVLPMIKMKYKKYFDDVVIPITKVVVSSIVIPISLTITLSSTLIANIVIFLSSVVSLLFSIFIFGMKKNERNFVIGYFHRYMHIG